MLRPVGTAEVHPRVLRGLADVVALRELSNVIAKTFLMMFEKSWHSGEDPDG